MMQKITMRNPLFAHLEGRDIIIHHVYQIILCVVVELLHHYWIVDTVVDCWTLPTVTNSVNRLMMAPQMFLFKWIYLGYGRKKKVPRHHFYLILATRRKGREGREQDFEAAVLRLLFSAEGVLILLKE